MSKGQITRREAMSQVTKIVAIAAGLSASELTRLLSAQTSPGESVISPIILQKSTSEAIQRLKTMLENSQIVFESQYGRATPVQRLSVDQLLPKIGSILPRDTIQRQRFLDQLAGMGSCMIQFIGAGVSGALGATVCTWENTCNGQETGSCARVNDCNGQECWGIFNCSVDYCDDQDACKCGNDEHLCGTNKDWIVSMDDLNRLKTDPYIGLLFTRYNVSTVQELVVTINRVLDQRRQQMIR